MAIGTNRMMRIILQNLLMYFADERFEKKKMINKTSRNERQIHDKRTKLYLSY